MIDDIIQPIAEPVPVKGKRHWIAGRFGIGDIAFNGVAQLPLFRELADCDYSVPGGDAPSLIDGRLCARPVRVSRSATPLLPVHGGIDVSGLPGPGAALLPGPGSAHDGHLPGSDPRLYRLFVAIYDLLPDRLLPDSAH